VHNHKTNHIHPKVAEVMERKEERLAVKTAEQLDATLNQLLDSAMDILESTKGKDHRVALQSINEARACIMAARKIADGVTVNVQINNVLTDEDLIARAKVYLGGT
jgi:hypothetical protein